ARVTLLMLAGIIALVPLIACANVASLFMARAVTRRPELASRLALGASRARVVRQLLTEGLGVALIGGLVGLALAYAGGEALRSFAPAALPRLSTIGIDGSVLAFTLAASFVMVPLFGLAPAIRGTNMRIAETLKAGGERGASGRGSRFRSLLVVTQVALSLMLMLASGLFVRSFLNLQGVDPGFRTEGVLSVNALLPTFRYETPEENEQAWDDVHRRLQAVPGVRAVGFVDRLPLGGDGPMNGVWAAERPPASAAEEFPATRRFASEGYFDALGIPLLAGRHFEEDESWLGSGVTGAVVINEALARRFFPGEDPLGKTLVLNWDRPVDLEVIGVTADIRETGPGADPLPTFYLPARWDYDMLSVLLRTEGDPLAVAGAVTGAIREVDDGITVSAVQTMQARMSNNLFQPRFRSAFVGLFALVALFLSSIGLYGVLAYFVRQRRHEISIRLALGAGLGGVARLVMMRGMTLVGLGILIGVSGALAGARVMQSWLFGIGVADPVTFVGVSFCLAAVASLACIIPALRAARLDPAEVMKAE
ncbi:FtsX-like permease family protein, partial [Gemmatimonadota bacterium]